MSALTGGMKVLALGVLLVLVLGIGGAGAKQATCTLEAETAAAKAGEVDPPIDLEVGNQSDPVLNFATGRGTKTDHIVLKASDSLGALSADQFELDVLTPMRRIGADSLESTELAHQIRYSRPRIFDHGERIGFDLCVSAAGGDPGTYAGQLLFTGPDGVSSATIGQGAQLKVKLLPFLLLMVVLLVLAGVFLWFKVKVDLKEKKATTRKWARVLIVGFSLVVVGAAMFGAYNESPAWGADFYASAVTLLGTGLAAGGLGSGLSAAVAKIADDI